MSEGEAYWSRLVIGVHNGEFITFADYVTQLLAALLTQRWSMGGTIMTVMLCELFSSSQLHPKYSNAPWREHKNIRTQQSSTQRGEHVGK